MLAEMNWLRTVSAVVRDVTGACHDLRTKLGTANNYAAILKLTVPDNTHTQQVAQQIAEAGDIVSRMNISLRQAVTGTVPYVGFSPKCIDQVVTRLGHNASSLREDPIPPPPPVRIEAPLGVACLLLSRMTISGDQAEADISWSGEVVIDDNVSVRVTTGRTVPKNSVNAGNADAMLIACLGWRLEAGPQTTSLTIPGRPIIED